MPTGQVLEDIEAALSRVGDGRPNVSDEAVKDFIRDADIYEAEFVMPVSAAELAEQQEAAAAAAAAAAAEAAAAANGDADASAEQAEAPEPVKPPAGNSKSKGKKAPPSNKKGAKAPGGKKGKKGAADEAADEDLSNPDASALRGPLVTLFSGATRVRKKNVRAAAATLKAEDGGSSGGGAGIKREPSEGGLDADADGAAGGSPSKDEDVAKMVSPLEELDDSGRLMNRDICARLVGAWYAVCAVCLCVRVRSFTVCLAGWLIRWYVMCSFGWDGDSFGWD
jgi:hypothetical protein